MLNLISAIHGCALQPENWPDALERLLGHMGGNGGMLWSHPTTPDAFGLRVPCRLNPESLAEYARTDRQQDVLMQAVLAQGLCAGEVLTDERLVPRATLTQSAFYRDFLQRFDYEHLLLAVLHRQDDAESMRAMPTVCLAMVRGQPDAPFGAGERKKLLALLPHLQHATAVNFQLAERDRRLSVSQAAVDLFCDALFFADRSGRVIQSNQAAKKLLADRDGLRLRNHRLAADDPNENRSLQCLFEPAEESAGLLRITRPSGKQAYVATRVKAAGGALPQAAYLPHLAVLIHDPEANTSARVTAIRDRYAFTAAESQIIAALLKTGSAKAAAKYLGLSENTMKTHLKSIFSKTGVHRQSELIQLALSFPRL